MNQQEYDKGYNDCIEAIKQAMQGGAQIGPKPKSQNQSDLPPIPVMNPLNPSKDLIDEIEKERQKAVEASNDANLSEEEKQSIKDYINSLKDLKEKAETEAALASGQRDKINDIASKARLQKIQKVFNEIQQSPESALTNEVKIARIKEKQLKGERDLKQYNSSAIQNFEMSLINFIRKEISMKRERGYRRPDRRFHNSNIISKGRYMQPNDYIPSIFVYYDQSASWNEDDIKIGDDAIGELNKYKEQGKINLTLFYFSNNVHNKAIDARREGGTCGQPVLEHIIKHKPDNVIIMTDKDIDDCSSNIEVPGAVWFLWKNGEQSQNLKDHLRGKKETFNYNLVKN